MNSIRIAAALLTLAVILGAFGAHTLKAHLSVEQLSIWKTGIEYHFYHALGLILIYSLFKNDLIKNTTYLWVTRLLLAGILCFSGSLYLLSTRSIHGLEVGFLGPITPIGGVFFILGWILLAVKAGKK